MLKGRGTDQFPANRFQPTRVERDADVEPVPGALRTRLHREQARSIITRNKSPDVGFDRSINPYRGCEHGCIYCFARPSHAYLDLSPGLDFETEIFYKANAAEQLRIELGRPNYRCAPIALGINTDAYQPCERELGLTRKLLEVLLECRHPVSLLTKSDAILRDTDLLAEMARHQLVQVRVSLTTLDDDLKRRLEPRTASGRGRLRTLRALADAGVPVGVMAAPMIPALNDAELETLLAAAAEHGARWAGYVLLRLPYEVAPLFENWLQEHYPLRAAHVLSLVRQSRGGKLNDPNFGSRMRGQGVFAELLRTRFRRACRRLGLNTTEAVLDCSQFRPPARPQADGGQLSLGL